MENCARTLTLTKTPVNNTLKSSFLCIFVRICIFAQQICSTDVILQYETCNFVLHFLYSGNNNTRNNLDFYGLWDVMSL